MRAFRQAFAAEIARLAGDRFDLGLLLLMPAVCLLLMGAMLSSGNPRGLGVIVVDRDRSPVSRQIIGAIDAVDSLRVAAVTPDLSAAFAQVRREQAIAVVVLPAGLAAARSDSAPPRVELYYQTAFLSTGAAVSLRLQAAIAGELAALAPRAAGLPGVALARLPLPGIELTVFGNPGVSLEWYLGLLIGPALLHLLVGVTTVASLAAALEQGSLRPWARRVGAPAPALLGRLLPHVAIGTLWLGIWLCWLMLGQGYRFGGSALLVMLGGFLLFGATATISALLVTLLGEVSTALSASVIYAGSALAYSGASLPLNGGPLPARLWSAVLPLTHYLTLEMDQTTGVLFGVWLRQASVLALMAVITGGLAALLLRRPPADGGRMTIRSAFEAALLEILRRRDLAAVAILSVLFYAVYYPAPYSGQVAERLPIAIVDLDRTPASRAVAARLAATTAVAVVARTGDVASARRLMQAREVEGVLIVPRGFGQLAEPARPGEGIALWLNGAYILRAEAVGKSIAEALRAAAETRLGPVIGDPRILPAGVTAHPLFNTTEGYRDYVFPAVANVILQQTLLFSVARLVAERRRTRRWDSGARPLLGVWAAATAIGTLAGLLYFGLVFWWQDIPHGGNIPALLLCVPLFAATVGALAIVVGSLVRSGDEALKLLLPTSIPIVFLTGFAWPLGAMPGWVRAVAWTIPATPATHIFVPLNQMGATLGEVLPAVLVLLAQCLAYAGMALVRTNAAPRGGPVKPL